MPTPLPAAARQPTVWLQRAFNPESMRAVGADSNGVCDLREGQSLVMHHAGGQGVVCLEGALWITHDPISRDRDGGERGDSSPPRGDTRMQVHALADSRLCLPLPLAA